MESVACSPNITQWILLPHLTILGRFDAHDHISTRIASRYKRCFRVRVIGPFRLSPTMSFSAYRHTFDHLARDWSCDRTSATGRYRQGVRLDPLCGSLETSGLESFPCQTCVKRTGPNPAIRTVTRWHRDGLNLSRFGLQRPHSGLRSAASSGSDPVRSTTAVSWATVTISASASRTRWRTATNSSAPVTLMLRKVK